jgi:hypothetical protein
MFAIQARRRAAVDARVGLALHYRTAEERRTTGLAARAEVARRHVKV